MTPLPVIDYVVAHELVHLEEKNHTKSFWNKVWLKRNEYMFRL